MPTFFADLTRDELRALIECHKQGRTRAPSRVGGPSEPRYERRLVTRIEEEGVCDTCGNVIWMGEVCWYEHTTGTFACSKACAEAAYADAVGDCFGPEE